MQPSCFQRHLRRERSRKEGVEKEKVELSIPFAVLEGITQAGALILFRR